MLQLGLVQLQLVLILIAICSRRVATRSQLQFVSAESSPNTN
jgi:hypothetical protein